MGKSRGAYRGLMEKPDGRRPLGRRRLRWENNIKINLREVGWESIDWIDLAQDREAAVSCKCVNKLSDSIKCGEFFE